ncbi:MAG TPA: hypothetical protein VFU63_13590 [Ktedonobacterales bacterium]|nr:hypothetical protein [Ktedonobacterales bacterium]
MMHFQPYLRSSLADEAKHTPPPPTPIVFEPAAPARWEYHVVAIDPREDEPLDEQALATLGGDGWLLANILTLPNGQTISRIYYYFVRQAE